MLGLGNNPSFRPGAYTVRTAACPPPHHAMSRTLRGGGTPSVPRRRKFRAQCFQFVTPLARQKQMHSVEVPPVMIESASSILHTAAGRYLGPYQLLLQIGRGGMADVFLALAPAEPGKARKQVVVKQLLREIVEDDDFRAMLLDEGRLATRLSHPNVVTTFSIEEAGDERFLVMEFLDGQPLSRIRRRAKQHGGVPMAVHLRVLSDVLRGVHYLHELCDEKGASLGVVHRDVTPHNIFVTYDGHVKVVDFGIAKAASRLSSTRMGVVKGKLAYLSPESVRGEAMDRRSDVFSVGVMLWEAAVGERFWADHDELSIFRRLACGDLPLGGPLEKGIDPRICASFAKRWPYAPRIVLLRPRKCRSSSKSCFRRLGSGARAGSPASISARCSPMIARSFTSRCTPSSCDSTPVRARSPHCPCARADCRSCRSMRRP